MELTHSFTVPASMAETWRALEDIESVAGCFPGAAVTGVEGDTFTGSCKVKLGPIALVYNGTGTFVEKDREAGRMRIEARGKDKRGNGTAGADVVATLVDTGPGSTEVRVRTDLNVTGKPAQFGRGVMQDVSDKLLGQFVDCLQTKIVGAPTESPVSNPVSDPPVSEPASDQPVHEPASDRPAPEPAPQPVRVDPVAGDDALDLGAAVIPVLLRTYRVPLLAGAAGVALILWWMRRR